MKCPNCKKPLLWQADCNYEDFGIEAQGVVQIYNCDEEDCITEQVQVFMNLNDEDEK